MMRFARPVVVALLALLFAVTPLSALIAPGEFEVRFSPDAYGAAVGPYGYTVRLLDRTGLAKGLAPAVPLAATTEPVANHGADGRTLTVTFGESSCDYLTHLTFERDVTGFLIRERTEESSCFNGTGMYHTVAIPLWVPIDASSVRLIADARR